MQFTKKKLLLKRKDKNKENIKLFSKEKIRIFSSIWLRIFIILAFGFFLYIASFLPEYASYKNILNEIGLALVVAMLIAITVERLTHETLLSRVNQFLGKMEEKLEIIKGAEDTGVEDIFARRFGEGSEKCTQKIDDSIFKQLKSKEGEILVLGVAAPDIFRLEKDSGENIHDMIFSDSKCNLKVLLLDNECYWGKKRQMQEELHDPEDDIKKSFNFLTGLAAKLEGNKDRILFKMYNKIPPTVFLIITEETAFVEPYPLIENPVKGPIGGRNPMIQFKSDSEAYKLWKEHFYFIWNNCSIYHPNSTQSRSSDLQI